MKLSFEAALCTFSMVMGPKGIIIDELEISGGPVQWNGSLEDLAVPEPLTAIAKVGERSLATFIDHLSPGGIRGSSVRVGESILVQGTVVKLIPISVRVELAPRIEGRHQLVLELRYAKVLGLPGAKALIEEKLAAANPVLDTSAWPTPVELRKLTLVPGSVHLELAIGGRQ